MSEQRQISPELLATFRRCTFAHRVFSPRPSLRAITPLSDDELPPPSRGTGEWYESRPYRGEPFDPDQYELVEGDWNHEHCDVCHAHVEDGMSYWPNVNPEAGHVDLCEACYPQVMALLRDLPDA
jgi:hypothetical protein